jgi:hypothetical protein
VARPRFSEMLANRRRELGLTISQASKVLKLKEQVLIAFEEGDFENIPKSGYAQGMLSSYARYLGLNPREVVDQFSEDLYVELNGTSSHELRRRTRESRGSGVSSNGRIFTAGEDPGATSNFEATGTARTRTQTWAGSQASPLVSQHRNPDGTYSANARPSSYAGYQGGYQQPGGYQTSGGYQPSGSYPTQGGYQGGYQPSGGYRQGQDRDADGYIPSGRGYPQGRPYTSRAPQQPSADRAARARSAQRRRKATSGPYAPDVSAASRSGGEVYTRDVPSRYVDDLRYNDEVDAYEAASTTIGRRSSRNIASRERPNVPRDNSLVERRQLQSRSRRQPPRKKGFMGALEQFFSDPRRAVITVLAVLAIALTLIIILSVRSCAAGKTSSDRTVSVSEVATSEASTTEASTTDEAATDAATTDEASTEAATTEQAVTETNVVVSVADGEVSWIEIECDGQSVVAETLTGPWEQSFTVTDSITIQAGNPSAVTVTNNGEKVQFTSKASGIGTMTIQGTQATTSTDTTTTDTTSA